jgi:hypothetical protein
MTAVRALTCPACGGQIEIKAAGYTVAVACQHCGSALDVSRPEVEIITRYNEAAAALTLPLGRRGTLDGFEWEVIGYLERSDGEADWNEYLLFNPYAGYRWLIEDGRKWQIGRPLHDRPDVLSESQVFWNNGHFRRDYEPATTETKKVVGEFYWRVQRGDTVEATTWSNFDQTLSSEWAADEQSWTALTPIKRPEVLAAFGLTPPEPPKPGGPGSWFSFNFSKAPIWRSSDLVGMFFLGFVTLIACWIVVLVTSADKGTPTTLQTLALTIDGPPQTLSLGTITVDRPYRVVNIEAWGAGFENKWVDLDYALIDKTSQRAISGYDTLQYYTGRDSEGAWSEGSTSMISRFGGVPRGVYEVVVEASAHDWRPGGYFDPVDRSGDPPLIVSFRAYDSGKSSGDLFWIALLVLSVPVIVLFARLENGSDE